MEVRRQPNERQQQEELTPNMPSRAHRSHHQHHQHCTIMKTERQTHSQPASQPSTLATNWLAWLISATAAAMAVAARNLLKIKQGNDEGERCRVRGISVGLRLELAAAEADGFNVFAVVVFALRSLLPPFA